jgi:hypothetical protein
MDSQWPASATPATAHQPQQTPQRGDDSSVRLSAAAVQQGVVSVLCCCADLLQLGLKDDERQMRNQLQNGQQKTRENRIVLVPLFLAVIVLLTAVEVVMLTVAAAVAALSLHRLSVRDLLAEDWQCQGENLLFVKEADSDVGVRGAIEKQRRVRQKRRETMRPAGQDGMRRRTTAGGRKGGGRQLCVSTKEGRGLGMISHQQRFGHDDNAGQSDYSRLDVCLGISHVGEGVLQQRT